MKRFNKKGRFLNTQEVLKVHVFEDRDTHKSSYKIRSFLLVASGHLRQLIVGTKFYKKHLGSGGVSARKM